LKLGRKPPAKAAITVAPHAGAWIETFCRHGSIQITGSPPMRGRGLKLDASHEGAGTIEVAPHAGAWIETK